MTRITKLSLTLSLLFSALVVVGQSSKNPYFIDSSDPEWSRQRTAFQSLFESSRASSDFQVFRAHFERLLTSPSALERSVPRDWLLHHEDALSLDERDQILLVFQKLTPEFRQVDEERWLRQERSRIAWRRSTQEERRRIYWEAVKNGSTTTWEGQTLDRGEALGRASREGLEEFAPVIEQYRQELDVHQLAGGSTPSAYLLWTTRLRSGAKDDVDGERLQARRVREMSDRNFRGFMEDDPNFRAVVLNGAKDMCGDQGSEPCRDLAAVVARQTMMQETTETGEDGKATLKPGPLSLDEGPSWLIRLRSAVPGQAAIQARESLKTEAASRDKN